MVNCVTCSALVPSSIFYVHACHPRGALPAHWACRMLSGPWGIVVVRASWPGHPTIIKKKKKQANTWKLYFKKINLRGKKTDGDEDRFTPFILVDQFKFPSPSCVLLLDKS